MSEEISKETARQVLLMLRGTEGLCIETDELFYPTNGDVPIESILEMMGFERDIDPITEQI